MSDKRLICGYPTPETIEAPGSGRTNCVRCGIELVIAPSGQKLVDEEGAQPYCWACSHREGLEGPLWVRKQAKQEFISIFGEEGWQQLVEEYPELRIGD